MAPEQAPLRSSTEVPVRCCANAPVFSALAATFWNLSGKCRCAYDENGCSDVSLKTRKTKNCLGCREMGLAKACRNSRSVAYSSPDVPDLRISVRVLSDDDQHLPAFAQAPITDQHNPASFMPNKRGA